MSKICDECETVAHCTKHGCVPKRSTKDAAMKLALEGAANYIDALGGDSRKYRQALAEQPAQQALDKMAENARELGLDYEPAQQEPVAITTGMALAFHRALTDGPINDAEAKEIKIGLEAAFANITTPQAQRTWVGLTDEEITDIWAEASPYYHEDDFARAIEAKLRSKNEDRN